MRVNFQGRRIDVPDRAPVVPPVEALLAGVPLELHDRVKALALAGPVVGIQITDPADRSTWKVSVGRQATAKQRRDLATVLGLTQARADLVDVEPAEAITRSRRTP